MDAGWTLVCFRACSVPVRAVLAPRIVYALKTMESDHRTCLRDLCAEWEDNVKFIFLQPKAGVTDALANITEELSDMTPDAQQYPVLSFFQAAMQAAVAPRQ